MNPHALNNTKVILFGTAYMGEEYLKVLKHLKQDVLVIGRDAEKAKKLATAYGYQGFGGGINALDSIDCKEIGTAIVATAVEALAEVSIACLKKGIPKVYIEKPGALNTKGLIEIKRYAGKNQKVLVAYNRRFYASVQKLKEILSKEKYIQGCFFDFTEREKDIAQNPKEPASVLATWGFANSTHVIDTAFFLVGTPKELHCQQDSSMERHPNGATFTGMGRAEKTAFSYFATWAGAGRWNVEVSTIQGRYKLCPLEELWFCKKNQFQWEKVEIDDKDDKEFKPGVKKMVLDMLAGKAEQFSTIDEQMALAKICNKIFGYAL